MAGSSTDEEAGMIKPFALRLFLFVFVFNIVGWLFCMLFFMLLLLLLFFSLSLFFVSNLLFPYPLVIGLLNLKFCFSLFC